MAPPDPTNNGAGTFYITEANITNTSFADITTGNCYVGFESILRRDTESKIIGITPEAFNLSGIYCLFENILFWPLTTDLLAY